MSLLSIQADQVKDPATRDALLLAQTRINALALFTAEVLTNIFKHAFPH